MKAPSKERIKEVEDLLLKTEETVVLNKARENELTKMPKIVVCPTYKSIKSIQQELISVCGELSHGVVLISLDEAIRLELPVVKAAKDFTEKKTNDIFLVETVAELIPKDYKDSEDVIDIDKLVKEFNVSKPQRNDDCPCGSEKKFKKCCLLS